MLSRGQARRSGAIAAVAVTALSVAACGSSGSSGSSGSGGSGGSGTTPASSNPQTLLKQTFAATHDIKSGRLKFSLVVTPKNSSVITTPLSLTFSGPFQTGTGGKTPESALTVAFSGLGKMGSVGLTTTSSGAYVKLEGSSYRLPTAQYDKLKSSLAHGSSAGGAPGLASLGIDPTTWLSNPQLVGTETVDGTTTEHVHSAVDVSAVISSVNKVLAKESSVIQSQGGIPTPHISPQIAQKATAAIKDPTVDVYTGKDDSILRRMVIAANVPVSGTVSTQLGGLTAASFRMSIDYTDLNQTESIPTPTNVKSYQALQAKLQTVFQQLGSEFGGGLGTSGTGATGGPSSTQVAKYSKCVTAAQGSATKLQRCQHLLQSGQ